MTLVPGAEVPGYFRLVPPGRATILSCIINAKILGETPALIVGLQQLYATDPLSITERIFCLYSGQQVVSE
jgi:hypothetical protein